MTVDQEIDFEDQIDKLRGEVDRLQRKLARKEDDRAMVADAVLREVRSQLPALRIPPVSPPPTEKRTKSEEVAIAVLSDWQLGKITDSYNSAVCEERIEMYGDKVIRLTRNHRADHPVKKIAVFLVGDMVEGEDIFPGQRNWIDSSLYRQVTVDGPRILGGLIRRFEADFEQVEIYGVIGNHGAVGGRSRRDYHPETNTDRMMYQVTRLVTENERVIWNVPDTDFKLVADLGDKCRFLLMHGHQVRGYAGIPWYGYLKKTLGFAALAHRGLMEEFDYMITGHFHTPTSMYWNDYRVWVNASTESHNAYALENLASMGRPAQWLLYAKPGFGVTTEHLVNLEER